MEGLATIFVFCWTLCFGIISAVMVKPQAWNDVLVLNRDIELGLSKDAGTNRDLHQWWDEFRELKELFESQFDDLICTAPEELKEIHDEIVLLHEKMELAWDLKQEQLQEIKEILYAVNYTDTGLVNGRGADTGDELVDASCEDIADYVMNANLTAWEEKDDLMENAEAIEDMEYKMNTHPCPCIWGEWEEWPACSTTCEAGKTVRERPIEKEAINNGTECLGDSVEEEVCNDDVCCPVDCVWGEWEQWQDCPSGCAQSKLRIRHVIVPAFCNGNECQGHDFEEMACSREAELAVKVADLKIAVEETCQR